MDVDPLQGLTSFQYDKRAITKEISQVLNFSFYWIVNCESCYNHCIITVIRLQTQKGNVFLNHFKIYLNLVLFVPRLGKKKIASVTLPTPNKNEKFHPLPEPTGTAPYHLPLDEVISKEQINRIGKSGSIAFHIVGDTGGTKSPTAHHT